MPCTTMCAQCDSSHFTCASASRAITGAQITTSPSSDESTCGGASKGKDRTLVAPLPRRYCSFSRAPSSSPTTRTTTSTRPRPSTLAAAQLRNCATAGTPGASQAICMSRSMDAWADKSTFGARIAIGAPRRRTAAFRALVSHYDALYQRMPYHVARGEEIESNAVHTFKHIDYVTQAGLAIWRQVDLRDVAGHDRGRTETDAG